MLRVSILKISVDFLGYCSMRFPMSNKSTGYLELEEPDIKSKAEEFEDGAEGLLPMSKRSSMICAGSFVSFLL